MWIMHAFDKKNGCGAVWVILQFVVHFFISYVDHSTLYLQDFSCAGVMYLCQFIEQNGGKLPERLVHMCVCSLYDVACSWAVLSSSLKI
jgi:hypothetical protein